MNVRQTIMEITESKCYRFVNRCNAKCIGFDADSYMIYGLI